MTIADEGGPLALPAEMTPAIRAVLGIPNFVACPMAELLRQDGRAIARKSEEEQAEVLWWLLGLAIRHGDGWKDESKRQFAAILDRVRARRDERGAHG